MKKSKLIILYGFASSGKSTLAKKYTDNHASSVAIEGDVLIGAIEHWRDNETQARKIVFEQTKSIAAEKLKAGYDVIIPYLLTDSEHARTFENIAKNSNVDFYEVYIEIEKEDVVNRLLERGVWGEEGSPSLTEKDLPEINTLFETMSLAVEKRSNINTLTSILGDIEGVYQQLLKAIQD